MTAPERTTDTDLVASTLADAFADDPLFAWVFQENRDRALATWWAFMAQVAAATERSELWRMGEGEAASIWYAPVLDAPAATEEDDTDDAPNPFVEMMTPLVGERLPEVLHAFGQIRDAHPTEAHWYLPAVGTRPDHQGRGLGARLLQPVLERCDAEGLGAYLESSNVRNVPFYHRLGFEITGELTFGDEPVVLTLMWRRPRAPAG